MAGGAFATAVVFVALAAGYRVFKQDGKPATTTAPAAESDLSFLYGRITTVDGGIYEGRLRWGGGEEAFWGDYFNGAKKDNSWAALVPPERLPKQRNPIEILGFEIMQRESEPLLVLPASRAPRYPIAPVRQKHFDEAAKYVRLPAVVTCSATVRPRSSTSVRSRR
jgi:hypothetical protein